MRRALFLFFCFGGYGIAQGCGGSDATIPDGSDDVTIPGNDSGGQDATQQNDTGTTDGGGGDGSTITDGGTTDSGGGSNVLLRCGDASVNDCSQCQGATEPCVYCGAFDASTMTGVCMAAHTNCFNNIPQGFNDCPCFFDASTCPESYQVCTQQGRCHTCEDNTTNAGLKCENGGTCNAVDGGCL